MLKVRLVHDYTKYNERLEKGIEGFAVETPEEQSSRKADDHFVKVEFEGVTTVDVLWKGLEIIDETYLAEKARIKEEYMSQLKTAENVVCTYGPKGGFRSLVLDFVENGAKVHREITEVKEGEDYLEYLKKYEVSIEMITLEKKEREKKNKN